MSWDKDLPDGDADIAQGDDDLRANNAAIESALALEHRFATGGNQSGRHVFDTDTDANLNARADDAEGSVGFSTDQRSGYYVLMIHDGTDFESADVEPVDGSGNPTLPRLNAQSKFTVGQTAFWDTATVTPGTPDALEIDWSKSPLQKATISGDTEFQNPVNGIANHGQTILLELTMSGAGHTLTWASHYLSPFGSAVTYSSADTALNLFYLQRLSSGFVCVTALGTLAAIP